MKDITNRIQELIDSEGVSKAEFAAKIGLNPSILSHVLSGRNKVSLKVILQLKEAFPDLDLDYLLTGEKSAKAEETAKPKKHVSERTAPSSPVVKESSEFIEKTVPLRNDKTPDTVKKDVERVIVLYSDKTMETYTP